MLTFDIVNYHNNIARYRATLQYIIYIYIYNANPLIIFLLWFSADGGKYEKHIFHINIQILPNQQGRINKTLITKISNKNMFYFFSCVYIKLLIRINIFWIKDTPPQTCCSSVRPPPEIVIIFFNILCIIYDEFLCDH